ncbi:hypothetical protein BDY21DRAFT_333618 [Lineolata rhizophorae]|uniref:Uncharacterized protein n=1 Tax=Lineolata rhizophorae TaxID=578093 RepID=A0A6A6PA87_9PEZI|nr:hypothetical protein BDY21DRAFT_333618 [Lineolata rhizophorae]
MNQELTERARRSPQASLPLLFLFERPRQLAGEAVRGRPNRVNAFPRRRVVSGGAGAERPGACTDFAGLCKRWIPAQGTARRGRTGCALRRSVSCVGTEYVCACCGCLLRGRAAAGGARSFLGFCGCETRATRARLSVSFYFVLFFYFLFFLSSRDAKPSRSLRVASKLSKDEWLRQRTDDDDGGEESK